MGITRFNIRVYMLLLNAHQDSLLFSDEIIDGEYYTKFPGGGLEYGEGILDCLHREAREELGQDIEVLRQFYTSEDFLASRFAPEDQVICVYYECAIPGHDNDIRQQHFRVADRPYDFVSQRDREQSLRWRRFDQITQTDLSFPLDHYVLTRLLDERKRS